MLMGLDCYRGTEKAGDLYMVEILSTLLDSLEGTIEGIFWGFSR